MSRNRILTSFVFALGLILGLSQVLAAGQQSFRVRIGLFQPQGESAFWEDKEVDFTGQIGDFEDKVVGVDYVAELNPVLSLILSTDYYQSEVEQAYLDYETFDGGDIYHDTALDITPLTAGLMFNLMPEGAPVRMFVGAGGGLYMWRLEEFGSFIDFDVQPSEIFDGRFVDEGEAFGYYLQAGLEIPLGSSLSLIADGRWDEVEDSLSGDFEGFGDLDLSGARYTFGIGWRF